MATERTNTFIQVVRKAVLLPCGAELTDGQLLGDVVERRDETAFAALVKRHGPMVWSVCRRLLGHHDAEDAFQATFLVLARKAATVAPRETLPNWLYGVAHRAALHARRTVARRSTRERQVSEMPEPGALQEDLWQDLQPVLDQELSRLPDHYRVLIVLCDLEGKTRKEAARQLGCPEGTVAGRLARARALLAKKLASHGLPLSTGALAVLLAQNVASASVPGGVISSTVQAGSMLVLAKASAAGAVSANVVSITEGVLKTMLLNKLKIPIAICLLLAGVGVGVSGTMLRMHAPGNGTGAVEKARPNAIAARALAPLPHKETEGGRPVKGLVGIARLVQVARKGSTVFGVEFHLKNISDKPITVCEYVGFQPLKVKWIGPDGKTRESKHYEWLKTADLGAITKDAFVTIPAGGGIQHIRPTIEFVPIAQKPDNWENPAEVGQHRVTISFTNNEVGKEFALQDVWTGTVTSNEVAFTVKKDIGLKLSLTADKNETVMKPDGSDAVPVNLKLTFTNAGDKDVTVNAYVLQWRLRLRCTGPSPDSVTTSIEYIRRPNGFLPAGAAKDLMVLAPGKSWSPDWTRPFPGPIDEGFAKALIYVLRKPGTYKLRVTLYENLLAGDDKEAQMTRWLESNEFELKVSK